MTQPGTPDRAESNGTQTEIFPVVGEPPPPPAGSPSGVTDDRSRWSGPDPTSGDVTSYSGWDGRFGTGDGGASAAAKGRRIARTLEGHVRGESPWLLGSSALLVALGTYWLASILLAFQHAPGMTGQDRALRLLIPGSFAWSAGVLLALALYCAGRRFELAPSEPGPMRAHLPRLLLAAAMVSLVAAALDVLVELANFGHGIDRALAGLLGYIGVMALAGATAWWAHRESEADRAR